MKDSFVKIASYADAHAANAALSCLREAVVAAFLTGENTASAFSNNDGIGTHIQLWVAQADTKRAFDLLICLAKDRAMPAGWEDDFSAEDGYWICPQCDAAVEEDEEACPWCRTPRPIGEE